MTVTLTPETETRLRQKAERDGQDINAVADTMLAMVLEWEAEEYADMLKGIQRGLEDSDIGRVRPFAEFAAEMRAKYDLPTHLSDVEIQAVP